MQSRRERFTKQRIQSLISFCISTCIHLAVGVSLALAFTSMQGEGRESLRLSLTAAEVASEMMELEVTTAESIEPSVEPEQVVYDLQSIAGTADPIELALAPASSNLRSSGRSQMVQSSVVSDIGTEQPKPSGKSRASFYGAEAYGNRFVFVIDSSGSMRGPRWESLCRELVRAIQTLSPDQEFFVISFDSTAHPMFGVPPPSGKFLKPSKNSVTRIQNWLRSIEHGNKTFPAGAMGIAMGLNPDAIFLLSDGEISDSTVTDLRLWNRKTDIDIVPDETSEDAMDVSMNLVPIHTVLLHSRVGYATLECIARENSGTFTPVSPP